MTTYPISKIRSGEVAVKIENYEQYKRLCDAVGDEYNDIGYYDIKKEYYGTEHNDNTVIFMEDSDLSTRTKIDFQQIDWEEGKITDEQLNKTEFNAADVINELNDQLSTLKAENERLKAFLKSTYQYLNLDDQKEAIKILQLRESSQSSQELSLKQRMAWEYISQNELTIAGIAFAFEVVDNFLNYKGGDDEQG